ncbi:MAG: uridine monophosphate kinase [Patescibacteria group bacterium]
MKKDIHKTILLKLSGEALGAAGQGVNVKILNKTAGLIKELYKQDLRIAIVVGAGNWFRKRQQGLTLEAKSADYMGITATLMNALALRQALIKINVPCLIQTFVGSEIELAEPINKLKAQLALQRNKVVIFAGGTGKPFFTTDTAAARQAAMIKADLLIKSGPVDGVYDKDPSKYKSAKKFFDITMSQALKLGLKVMDREAFVVCRRNKIPILVCKWGSAKRLIDCLATGRGGTLVKP